MTSAAPSLLLKKPRRPVPTFHTLTVHSIEPLTDDSAAVSFTVPDEIWFPLASEMLAMPSQPVLP